MAMSIVDPPADTWATEARKHGTTFSADNLYFSAKDSVLP
jgi:hypothetical protein